MKALVIDDDYMSAEHLGTQINRHCPEIGPVEVFDKASEALLYLKNNPVDVLFLDIEMPQMSGFELIEIAGRKHLPPIIFTTAHSQYAIDAIKVQAVDYLLKPVDPAELKEAVNRLATLPERERSGNKDSAIQPPQDRLVLASGQFYHLAHFQDIIRVEANGSYSEFFLTDGQKIVTSKNLKNYEDQLISKGFLRTHQSHLVNRFHIKGYNKADGGELILEGGAKVPISTRLRKSILDKLQLTS